MVDTADTTRDKRPEAKRPKLCKQTKVRKIVLQIKKKKKKREIRQELLNFFFNICYLIFSNLLTKDYNTILSFTFQENFYHENTHEDSIASDKFLYSNLNYEIFDITETSSSTIFSSISHTYTNKGYIISDVLLWTPTYSQAKAGRPARTYIQELCEDTGCSPDDLPEAMNDREKWRERVRDIRAGGTI